MISDPRRFEKRWHWIALALLTGLLLSATGAFAATPAPPDTVDPALLDLLVQRGTADFVVELDAQTDVTGAARIDDWRARGRAVYDALRDTARRAQAPVIAYAEREGLSYRAFFSANRLIIEGGSLRAALDVAALPGVAWVRAPRSASIDPGLAEIGPAQPRGSYWNLGLLDPAGGSYGIQAAQVWDVYGVRGAGIVVANIDTGVYYEHEALVRQYRGNLGAGAFDHDYNWYLPTYGCGDGTAPCDNHSHGTATMGIMVGETANLSEQTGAAPAAEWIACKGCEGSFCSEAALLGCADWMLAPCPIGVEPGDPACDPDLRPHVVNNSWGGDGGDGWYRPAIQAWIAAGIFPAFSAGNAYGCTALGSPGDAPEAFGTTAHTSSGSHLYASGPSTFFPNPSCDPAAHEIDPHLSAPTYVRAPYNQQGGYFFSFSGTSAASPHTAGAVALLWSAVPELVGSVDSTFTFLEQSANGSVPAGSCGKPACAGAAAAPNFTYGWGYLDALGAVELARRHEGGAALAGLVTEAGGSALPGVSIDATSSPTLTWHTTTDAAGAYRLALFSGTYTLEASRYGYWTAVETGVRITGGVTATWNVALEAATFYTVSGTVTDGATGWPLYARIDVGGFPGGPFWTDPQTGQYALALAEGVTHTFHVSAWTEGYISGERVVAPLTGERVEDFALEADAAACGAPGRYQIVALAETFDVTPTAWTAVDNVGNGQVWRFDDPGRRGNLTGGEGGFAGVDSLFYGYDGMQDTELRTPVLDVSGYATVTLAFGHDFYWYNYGGSEVASVGVSLDGGLAWTPVFTRAGASDRGPQQELVDLTALAAGQPGVMLRFRYYDAAHDNWWQVDDVVVGDLTCRVGSGGLVVGHVYDDNTGAAVVGAAVVSVEGGAISAATPDDPAVGDGFYVLFAPDGPQTITATMSGYATAMATATVVHSEAVWQDVYLTAGRLAYAPPVLTATLDAMATVTLPLTLENTGGAALAYEIGSAASWLSATPVTGSMPVSGSQVVSVTIAGIHQPGVYQAALTIAGDTPYPSGRVPVTVTVLPLESWGKLAGTVTGLGYCDAAPSGLEGAVVRVENSAGVSWTVTTDAQGEYWWWLDEARSPLTVTASHDAHSASVATGVLVTRGLTTTASFDLRWLQPCVRVVPEAISVTHWMGLSSTVALSLTNSGAVSTPFTLGGSAAWLTAEPVSGTLAAGGRTVVEVTARALPTIGGGVYVAALAVDTHDPVQARIDVPVTMEVEAEFAYLPLVMRE
ncbi:MAG: carboxypeptidase regulatory-like domain-containing protein [Anaerolineae bacterium]|nr:carboxypeptidase regulatory-like domain-containing protein [Anaerolineae bacterium]